MITLNTVAVLVYLISGILILHRYRETIAFYGFFFFMQSWALISCWYNDLGMYNPELFRYTDTSLATSRLALFCLLFNVGFVIVAQWLKSHPLVRSDYVVSWGNLYDGQAKLLLSGVVVLLYVYIGYVFVRDGVPIFQGIDRLLFVNDGGNVERLLLVYGPFLAFLLGYFRPDDKQFSTQSLLMGSFVIYKILTANKFSGLMAIVIPYYLPIIIRRYLRDKSFTVIRAKYFAAAGGVITLLLGFAFVTYVSLIGSSEGAYRFLLDRVLANQGQIWWAIDNDTFDLGGTGPNLGDAELSALISPGSIGSDETGMKALMIHILGPDLAYPIIDKGYLYTMAYPAILVATLPYGMAAIVQVLAGGLLALCLFYLYFCIAYRHLLRAGVALSIVLPLMALLATGNVDVFLTPGLLGKGAFLAIAEGGLMRTNVAGVST